MLADELDYVVGVDTHRDEHVLAVVVAPTGGVIAQRSVQASARGYAAAVRFADEHAPGARVWAVEGAGHYGAGLARHLSGRGETVIESGRGPRDERRLRGKDDPLDAVRAARAALASEKLVLPRTGQRREALRLLLVARRSAVEVRRRALVQLRSVIVTAPDRLRDQLQALPERRLLERCSHFRRSSSCPVDELAAKLVLRTLARRIEAATFEAEQLERELLAHVRALAPRLLAPRPRPLRSRLRPARRRRARPSLKRANDSPSTQPRRRPPTQPRTAHDRLASPTTRPDHTGLHRSTRRRRQEPPRSDAATQALPRPPPLPTTATDRAAHDLTGHRSIISNAGPGEHLQCRRGEVVRSVPGRSLDWAPKGCPHTTCKRTAE